MSRSSWLKHPFLLLAGLLAACQAPTVQEQKPSHPPPAQSDSAAFPGSQQPRATGVSNAMVGDTSLPEVVDSTNEEITNYFLVIVDTGTNYYALRNQMIKVASSGKVPIDTMGRTFDKVKNRIILPEDDEDEMYAGDYYPRRVPSRILSLEYLGLYQKKRWYADHCDGGRDIRARIKRRQRLGGVETSRT